MQKRTQLALALTALTAALASCGTPSAPVASAPLVKVEVTAPMVFGQGRQGLGAQGLTADAPARHYDVTVRDSSGKIVAFTGTTFDPTGAGTTTLRLNDSNNFKQTLLLPAGEYSFENKVKDDATGSVLLAYGPGSENKGTVDANFSLIRLKSHAVLSTANTTLSPSMTLNELYTDTKFNLSLNLKTATVANGNGATVPTSDIGAVTYTLGNATDGVLNGAGSKIGVNVTSRGTDTDSELNVTASFSAWVQTGDTAAFQPVSVNFAKQIQTNVMTTDTVMPSLTLNAAAPTTGTTATLTGTVSDDVMVQGVRVYVDGNLVASMDAADGVGLVTGDGNGGWTAPWLPSKDGTYAVTVIAEDSSGNETRVDQSVTATTPVAVTYDFEAQQYSGAQTPITVKAGQINTFKVNYAGNASELHVWAQTMSCATDCGSNTLTMTMVAPDGSTPSPSWTDWGYVEYGSYYQPWVYTITLTTDFDGVVDLEAHTH